MPPAIAATSACSGRTACALTNVPYKSPGRKNSIQLCVISSSGTLQTRSGQSLDNEVVGNTILNRAYVSFKLLTCSASPVTARGAPFQCRALCRVRVDLSLPSRRFRFRRFLPLQQMPRLAILLKRIPPIPPASKRIQVYRQPPSQRSHRNHIPDPFSRNRHHNKIHLRWLVGDLFPARPPRRPHRISPMMSRPRQLHLHPPQQMPTRIHHHVVPLVVTPRLRHHHPPLRRLHREFHLRQIAFVLRMIPSHPCSPLTHKCSFLPKLNHLLPPAARRPPPPARRPSEARPYRARNLL